MAQDNTVFVLTDDNKFKFRSKLVFGGAFHKRIWRLLMLVIKGWCYYD